MEGESGATGSVIDEIHSWDIQGAQMEHENGVTEISLMNFILEISNYIK